VSARGFNGILARNLLVLIDGRTVYSPVFGGVYWDVQDCLLEDVERIEVIRGPGGTLWGANAVNGVINVITKKAGDTQGTYLAAGGGTVERSNEAVRYGGKIGEDCQYRVYGKYFDRAPFEDPIRPANDGWNQGRVGFRADWQPGKSKQDFVTFQGDHYVGTDGTDAQFTNTTAPYTSIVQGTTRNSGQNVLARWRHAIDDDSDWTLQTYYDDYDRDTVLLSEKVKTYDLEFQYHFPIGERSSITCGAGYRHIFSACPSTDPFTLSLSPEERSTYVANQFVQDEIKLVPDYWTFTIGCKLEQNSYTNIEYEPSARLLWTPDKKHSVWGAVSRAVHTPTEINASIFNTNGLTAPAYFSRAYGNPYLQSEALYAFELGYREQLTDRFSYDIATFCNYYNQLFGGVQGAIFSETDPAPAHNVRPSVYGNLYTANSYGVELGTNWSIAERWRLYTQYTYFYSRFSSAAYYATGSGGTPANQVYMMSSWELRKDIDFDLMARYVDRLSGYNVPSYITMDARLAWRPRKHLELAVVGQNLLQAYHAEYGYYNFLNATNNAEATLVPRGVYGTVTMRY
jgi:iron complex outermembrane receptor protein